MILIDSVLKKDKSYYLQVISEECKCIIQEKEMKRYIKDDLELSSDGSDEEIFDIVLFDV